MGRADFRRAVHEVGEKRELPLDIAFVPAAIDEEHGARFTSLSGGDGRRGVAEALAAGDDEDGLEAGKWPGRCRVEVVNPEGVEDISGVGVGRETLRSSSSGTREKVWPLALRGLKETVIGRLREKEEKGGGDLSVPALGRQPAKAPIWEAAAFFSTWASGLAS